MQTPVTQRVVGIALGYEDLVDHDELRPNPVLAALAGKSTLNRIKECQLDLFADRTSSATMRANQLRLWFPSPAYAHCARCVGSASRGPNWPTPPAARSG